MKQKTITICGKEVQLIYCAATENTFEELSEKSMSLFVPESVKDESGNETFAVKAKMGDFLRLAIAAMVAAYSKLDEEMPLTFDDVMYNSTPADINKMIEAVVELRNEWYKIPEVVKQDIKNESGEAKEEKEDSKKN